MFVSTYEASLDSKGRVSVPAPFRHALNGSPHVYLLPSPNGAACLEGGGEALMQAYAQLVARIPPSQAAAAAMRHAIFGRAVKLKLDDTGRMSIAAGLLEAVGIKKDLIFVGALDRFNIWSPETFTAFETKVSDTLPELQDALMAPFEAVMEAGHIPGLKGSSTGAAG